MSAYEAMTRISTTLLKNSMEQAEIHAAGIFDMLPPPAAANALGGLLDVRA
jgi:hypothetical protein